MRLFLVFVRVSALGEGYSHIQDSIGTLQVLNVYTVNAGILLNLPFHDYPESVPCPGGRPSRYPYASFAPRFRVLSKFARAITAT